MGRFSKTELPPMKFIEFNTRHEGKTNNLIKTEIEKQIHVFFVPGRLGFELCLRFAPITECCKIDRFPVRGTTFGSEFRSKSNAAASSSTSGCKSNAASREVLDFQLNSATRSKWSEPENS